MGRKKEKFESKVKRKNTSIMIKVKKEIVAKYESGIRVSDLAIQFGMAKSTISTIIKKKEEIKKADVARGMTVITKQRSQTLEDMEKLLVIWVNESILAGNNVSEVVICEKARQMYDELLKKCPSATNDGFKASKGWLEKFKKRSGISLNKVRRWVPPTVNQKGVEECVEKYSKYINAHGFTPEQVFNCDESDLFRKKVTKRANITQENAGPGLKRTSGRLTLLLCGNASGDFKISPLLVYYSENPKVFKKNNIIKSKWPIIWKASSKVWVTRQCFSEWIREIFAPSVKKYLQEKNLPQKCLLVVGNALAHFRDKSNDWNQELDFITVKSLPLKTTPILQPLNQQVISNFKKLYTKALFQKCFEITTDTELTLKDFWKQHFNILHSLILVDKAWHQMTYRTMNSVWGKLWPECVADKDLEGAGNQESFAIDDIVSVAKTLGLVFNSDDIEEVLEEISMEELEQLQEQLEKVIMEDMFSDDDDDDDSEVVEKEEEDVPASLLHEICAKLDEVQSFVELYHPDRAVASCSINIFNDTALCYFRNILKRRHKQITLNNLLRSQNPRESEAETSSAKRQKKEKESFSKQ